jgi:hypothetical protein
MNIDILGTESLGVRGLSCSVKLHDRKIVIDPGIALGWNRYGYLPHPFQIAVGRQVREKIIGALAGATDIVFSHFDGDHVPLAAPNPYQLGINAIKKDLLRSRIWAKGAEPSSRLENRRRIDIEDALKGELPAAEGSSDGAIQFSMPLQHGLRSKKAVTVMMTRIEEDGFVFVHASDHQFMHVESIEHILSLNPDVVLSSGPALYLENLSKAQQKHAIENAVELSRNIKTLIIDHHLLRDERGLDWLKYVASATGNEVLCAAEFMGRKPLLLEAWREELYERMPVPEGWHEAYARGEVGVEEFLVWGFDMLEKKGRYIKTYK